MKFILSFLLTIPIIHVYTQLLASSRRSAFGEECNKTRRCDRRAWLSCFEGLCDCSRPEEMHYDTEKQKCVTKSGERCKYGVDENWEIALVEITECVPNSRCSEDGICVCDSKYHEVFNGTCALSQLFGEPCSLEGSCSSFEKLQCINGTCGCQEEISAYSIEESQCVGILNQNCIDGKCFEGAECKEEKCVCEAERYEDSSSKTCVSKKGIKEKCTSDSECIHGGSLLLKCRNGTCDCQEGISTYSIEESQCVGVLNQNCIDGKCFEGGECKEEKCVCATERYEDSSSKTCVSKKGIKEKCTSDLECFRGGPLLLKCINGTCDCQEGLKYSKVQKYEYSITEKYYQYSNDMYLLPSMNGNFVEICAPYVGGKCPDGYCTQNAKCVITHNQLSDVYSYMDNYYRNNPSDTYDLTISLDFFYNERICECIESFSSDKDRSQCGKDVGYSCNRNDDCFNNLVCDSGGCKCHSPNNQKYLDEGQYCVTNAGGHCKLDADCADNSFCQLLPNATVGHCQCQENYLENDEGFCYEIIYGNSCEDSKYKCDSFADLVCRDQKCSCKNGFMQKYSPTARKCLGLVGTSCDPTKDSTNELPSLLCVANAHCKPLVKSNVKGRCSCIENYKENEDFTCALE